MKLLIIKLSTIVLILSSCSTDFEVNSEWAETTVVFGLLDAGSDSPFGIDTQYVRINKAYLGENDAFKMAQFADSINFDPANLLVKLHKLNFNDTVMSIVFDTTLINKDSLSVNGDLGAFSTQNNIVYRVVIPPNFIQDDRNYALTIKNIKSGNKVSSSTEVISNFSFKDFNPSYKFGFYNPSPALVDSLKFLSKTIKWNRSQNGLIYQLDIIFNYLENDVLKSLIWSQDPEVYAGISMQTRLEGGQFFNFIRQSLLEDNSLIRQFVNIDLVMTVGTENLNTYIKVNSPITSIAQQRPPFTNINNGIGIFSSRYTYAERNIGLTQNTIDFLINDLNRNFQ